MQLGNDQRFSSCNSHQRWRIGGVAPRAPLEAAARGASTEGAGGGSQGALGWAVGREGWLPGPFVALLRQQCEDAFRRRSGCPATPDDGGPRGMAHASALLGVAQQLAGRFRQLIG